LAMALQISMWLQDHDTVDALFGRLLKLRPDEERLRLAWVGYFERQKDTERLEAVYEKLVDRYPDDLDLRITWAQSLKRRNEYARALEALTRGEVDTTSNPRAALLLSDCLFAEQRFDEAVTVLEDVDREVPSAEQQIWITQIDQVLGTRTDYIELWDKEQERRYEEAARGDLPRAVLRTEKGLIEVELYEEQAPNTVANFISLAESGFWDGTTFHRVIPNFMAQGGDPNSREGAEGVPGQGGPGYRIHDEHDREGARLHFTGSLSMANTGAPHTGGSQFFLTVEPTPHLNGKHTVFGHVTRGLEVVRQLEMGDGLETVVITSKRDHDYVPQTLPEEVETEPAPLGFEPVTGEGQP
ncbi:MAG: peptidylprolyl isomerase, partial [Planctomycetota bacterium]